jgi:hypothetical protein
MPSLSQELRALIRYLNIELYKEGRFEKDGYLPDCIKDVLMYSNFVASFNLELEDSLSRRDSSTELEASRLEVKEIKLRAAIDECMNTNPGYSFQDFPGYNDEIRPWFKKMLETLDKISNYRKASTGGPEARDPKVVYILQKII